VYLLRSSGRALSRFVHAALLFPVLHATRRAAPRNPPRQKIPRRVAATYIPDILGSIVASLDASSGTLTKAGFLPYGESATTPTSSFGCTGERVDAETNGLYDFRARIYSPSLGRFMQADPIGAAGGINLYAYVGNDPLNLWTFSGWRQTIRRETECKPRSRRSLPCLRLRALLEEAKQPDGPSERAW
jgi:RHS repeat-associated protein